jgi:hypothetical protein
VHLAVGAFRQSSAPSGSAVLTQSRRAVCLALDSPVIEVSHPWLKCVSAHSQLSRAINVYANSAHVSMLTSAFHPHRDEVNGCRSTQRTLEGELRARKTCDFGAR